VTVEVNSNLIMLVFIPENSFSHTSSLTFMSVKHHRICLKFYLYLFVKLNITQNIVNNFHINIYYYYCNCIKYLSFNN